jgi:hypothetical protein
MGTPEASVWGCPWRGKALGHYVGGGDLALNPFLKLLPAPVAEKTKEQASHLGGAVFSGAGNIAAATGLVKKEEFPTDLKASAYPHPHAHPTTCHTYQAGTHICHHPLHLHFPSLGHKLACLPSYKSVYIQLKMKLWGGVYRSCEGTPVSA